MGRKTVVLMPQSSRILQDMGNQIKLARLRRRISVDLVAERAGVSRASVWAVEKGSPSVAIGIYAAVLHGIDNMDRDLLKVAGDDKLGRTLQDLGLPTGRREKD
ncbi:MAG: helix-turn-helix domain-containing protein [Sphaerochaetaceae bacterium]|jgi:transcriptional regulator with XRE-family HTH domain|nr:helix-turn-helix domain-containing protein [Sphaerochaetaceae bacterium]MDD3163900.1 helix-turn-helix domain-containing protein [Sphaerochaetaceae bacterium]MDD4007105.1 helix-turn-helix domain-containing protein [Sphaerochaetaceae bacterium]MDD4397388.1 helix-turn-helix domain-containing protein [Sphaerochaetaceae bacterium]